MPLVSIQDNDYTTLDVADFNDGGFGTGSVSTMRAGASRGRQAQQTSHRASIGAMGNDYADSRQSFMSGSGGSMAVPQQMLDAADAVDEMSVMTLDTALQDVDHGGSGRSLGQGAAGGRHSHYAQQHDAEYARASQHLRSSGGEGDYARIGQAVQQMQPGRYATPLVQPVDEGAPVLDWGEIDGGGHPRDRHRSQQHRPMGGSGGGSPHASALPSLTDENDHSHSEGGAMETVAQSAERAASFGTVQNLDPPGVVQRSGSVPDQAPAPPPAQAQAQECAVTDRTRQTSTSTAAEYTSSLEMQAAQLNFQLAQAQSQIDTLNLRNRKLTEELDDYRAKFERGTEEIKDLERRLEEALRRHETDRMRERMAGASSATRSRSSEVVSCASDEESPGEGDGGRAAAAQQRQRAVRAHRFSRRPSAGNGGELDEDEEEAAPGAAEAPGASARREDGWDEEDPADEGKDSTQKMSAVTDVTDYSDDGSVGFPVREPSPQQGRGGGGGGGILGGMLHGLGGGNKTKKSTTPSDDSSLCGVSVMTKDTTQDRKDGKAGGGGGDKKDNGGGGKGGWFSGGGRRSDPRDEVWDEDPFSTVVQPRAEASPDPAPQGGWLKAFGRRGSVAGRRGSAMSDDDSVRSRQGDCGQGEGDSPIQA